MDGPPATPLTQNPDWWSESWGVTDWLDTLFSTPLEVHAFLLGAFIAVAIASLTLRQGERTTFALVLVVFLFTYFEVEAPPSGSAGLPAPGGSTSEQGGEDSAERVPRAVRTAKPCAETDGFPE